MTEPVRDTDKLARRAVACKGWRWMPGMAVIEDGFRGFVYDDRHIIDEAGVVGVPVSDTTLPDLTDPATLGCLLALVREAWGGSGGTHLTAVGWRYYTPNQHLCSEGATEAGALVAALEAAGGE